MYHPADRIAHTTAVRGALVAMRKRSMGPRTEIWVHHAQALYYTGGARCSSVVRALAHGAMGRRIDVPW